MWAVAQILILIQFKKEQGNVEIKTNSYHQPLFDTGRVVLFQLTKSS